MYFTFYIYLHFNFYNAVAAYLTPLTPPLLAAATCHAPANTYNEKRMVVSPNTAQFSTLACVYYVHCLVRSSGIYMPLLLLSKFSMLACVYYVRSLLGSIKRYIPLLSHYYYWSTAKKGSREYYDRSSKLERPLGIVQHRVLKCSRTDGTAHALDSKESCPWQRLALRN